VVSNEVYVVIEGIAAPGRARIEVVGKAIKAFKVVVYVLID